MKVSEVVNSIVSSVSRYIVGHEEDIKLLVITLLAEGHALVYGPPGTAKTLLSNLVASTLGLKFKKIQFTPDILPSDIIGAKVIDPKTGELRTVKGPIFANVVLADEINRANPKSLSALLEAMQEGRVSIEGDTYELPKPFFVIATLNPLETQGIFQLPIALLDRFMISLLFDYPSKDNEVKILVKEAVEGINLGRVSVNPVVSSRDIDACMKELWHVKVNEDLVKYTVDIVRRLRSRPNVYVGPSPRAALHVLRIARGLALIDSRDYVIPDDIKKALIPTLGHRVILKEGINDLMSNIKLAEELIKEVLNEVEVPL